MKKSLTLTAALLLSVFAFGQSKDKFFQDYVVQSWNSEDGIPGNSITDICQDDDGYIYFGTYGGLVRFDGVKFNTISKLSNPECGFFSARAIMQDSNGNIWVGSNDEGAFCITPSGEVIAFTIENGLPNNSVRSFCEDQNGNIWIGTASGIAWVSPKLRLCYLPGFDRIPHNNRLIVTQIYCDTAGRVWIITRNSDGTYIYSDEKFELYTGIKSLVNPAITTMTQDATGGYWFGISPHYAVKKVGNEETLYDLGKGAQKGTVVNSIFIDSSKNLWFGLDNGITIIHDGIMSYYDKEQGLSDESVVKIIEDKEKNIWVATDRGGAQKFSYGKFQTTNMSTTVNAIAQDSFRKVVWLGCDNGVYCYVDGYFQENKITDYCKNVRVRHVSVTKDGALLVSCYEKYGQLKFNIDGTIEHWDKENGLCGERVRVAEEMENGDLYIGTTTGLSIVDKKTGVITTITKKDNIPNEYIMCLYEDPDGNVWVGTDGGGVFVLQDKKVIRTLSKEDNLAGNVVFKIVSYRDGEIWFCTGTGVSRLKDNKLDTFGAENGFMTDGVFQLISDFSGRMWGTSNHGIFYVKIDDLNEVAEGRKSVLNPKFFNRLDGITSGGVTSTSLSLKDDLGRIWFTLIDGFTIFDPVRNASTNPIPSVKIEDVYIDSEKTDISNGVVIIPPAAKRININFTGITFVSSEQVLFQTKLKGFDKNYSEWSNFRQASYTNLKPGTYEFSVIAQNGDEFPSLSDAHLTIIKEPYLWQRPWFMTMVIFIILFLIILAIGSKIVRMRKEQERTEKLSIEVIQALVGTIDAKDKYTNGHSTRVAEYAQMLAEALGEKEDFQKKVYFAALLHDIGKIGIPDTIINKPAELNEEEYDIIKTHPEIGSQILSSISTMKDISIGSRGHHEHYDGTGYPDGLKGEQIPLIARIIGVADAYDAMTSNRSYRKYMQQSDVRSEIEKNIGTQFDPAIAKKMLEIMDRDVKYTLHE